MVGFGPQLSYRAITKHSPWARELPRDCCKTCLPTACSSILFTIQNSGHLAPLCPSPRSSVTELGLELPSTKKVFFFSSGSYHRPGADTDTNGALCVGLLEHPACPCFARSLFFFSGIRGLGAGHPAQSCDGIGRLCLSLPVHPFREPGAIAFARGELADLPKGPC